MKTQHGIDVPTKQNFEKPKNLPLMKPEKLVKGKFQEDDKMCMTGWMLNEFLDSEEPFVDAYKEFRCTMMDFMYSHFSEDHANNAEQRSKLWNMTAEKLGYNLVD